MNSLISVIVPAFNAEKTIKRCINSIQNQTHNNLEIVVVNDGSTDGTLKILNELTKADKRIKVINIPNGGVSHARNIGVDNATGEYITFVDSDDTVEPDMYEHLMSLINKYNVKIAHCSYSNYSDDGVLSYVGNHGKILCQNHDEALECLIEGKFFAGGMWNKLYCAELFDGIRLDESIKINEDLLANYFLFDKADGAVYSDLSLYNYYQYNDSSTSSTGWRKRCIESHYVANLIYNHSKGYSYEKAALNRLAGYELDMLKFYCCDNKTEVKKVKNNIKKYHSLNCYARKNQRISVYLLLYCPVLFRVVYYLYNKIRTVNYDPEQ